jgi:chromate reductase, NAD(P)H dehydrogenase (quinone)
MNKALKIVAVAGSLRKGSYNKQVLQVVVDHLKSKNVDVNLVDLSTYSIPLFNQDLEASEGMPAEVKKLKQAFTDANAIIIASPEYNASITGVLKNAIDWISRGVSKDESMYFSFSGKPAGIISASPGGLGGMRGLFHVRDILTGLGCPVMPEQVCVKQAHEGMEPHKAALTKFADNFCGFANKLI